MTARDQRQDHAFITIRAIINKWNPFGLADEDNIDEFENEVRSLIRQLARVKSPEDAAHAISRTFSSSFNDADKFSVKNCTEVGQKLFQQLSNEGLI